MTTSPRIKCKNCNIEMKLIGHKTTMDEPDYDMTEGQMADYFGALESGDFGNWAVETSVYQCPKCKIFREYQFF